MNNLILERVIFRGGDAILGSDFIKSLSSWRQISRLGSAELENLQSKRLKDLLVYVSKHNTYYRQFLDPVSVENEDPVELLKQLPILDKAIIRSRFDDLISDPFFSKREELVEEKSSGSSGIQGRVLMSRKEALRVNAAQTHLWEWAGFRLGNSLLQLGMGTSRSLIKSMKDLVTGTVYKPAFIIDEHEVRAAMLKFRNKKTKFFGGYASGLYAYACIVEKMGIDIQFRSVISWGDKMFSHYRKKIESVFNTKVYDVYGCTEGIIISGQCAEQSYHVLTPFIFLELLDDNGKEVSPGQIGHVVVTRLDGYSFPLIRYRLGDLAIAAGNDGQCRCGMHYPQLSVIVGRNTDIVYTPAGKPLIVHFFTGIFEYEQDISQFRIIQYEDRSIVVEYISALTDPGEILEKLRDKMNRSCGEILPLTFQRVNSIPNSASGKPQIIWSCGKAFEKV